MKLELSSENATHFEDVIGKWHEGYVGSIYKAGLMKGTSATTFTPDSNITKEELAVVLSNSFDFLKVTEKVNIKMEFIDSDQISSWAMDSVVLVNYIGLLEGVSSENGLSFFPKSLGDRQLAAKLIYELIYNKEVYSNKIKDLIIIEGNIDDKSNNHGNSMPSDDILASIVSKYNQELRTLQSKIELDLDTLVLQASIELKAGGAVSTIYNKYEKLARDLEASTDSAVFTIISNMEKELKENGFDTNAADELYEEYNRIKSEIEINIPL